MQQNHFDDKLIDDNQLTINTEPETKTQFNEIKITLDNDKTFRKDNS